MKRRKHTIPNAIVDPLNAGLDLKKIEFIFYTLNSTIFLKGYIFLTQKIHTWIIYIVIKNRNSNPYD